MPDIVHVNYERTGHSKRLDALGMRAMQARVFEQRRRQYLLVKAPPASGKSRALMFVGLDKLENQGLRKVIVAVPERSIGRSFEPAVLSRYGFFHDWNPKPDWNLCIAGAGSGQVARRMVATFKSFLDGSDQILVCTHATLRFAFDQVGAEAFDDCLLAVDEFHHASASEENRLGEVVRALMRRDRAHIAAMTGSYFRGDAAPVLMPEDEARFTTVTYTYYEQLNGYEHLRSLGIGYHFYRGSYLEGLPEVLNSDRKTILHIPHPNSRESTGDKYAEVERILEVLGTYRGADPATGFLRVERPDGQMLKVANLVDDDDPAVRARVSEGLRHVEKPEDVDIILALGMAKEGFDWIWCEHALTIGYRNSLTEIVQIVGRTTRDAPGKEHAQFTNLVAEPDARSEDVVDAVNDMLKAITASLLMEQVLAPDFNFRARREDETGSTAKTDETGGIEISVGGLAEPSTERVQAIVNDDMDDLIARVCQDPQVATHATANPEVAPETVNQVMIPRILEERYPQLGEQEREEVRQQLVARMAVASEVAGTGRDGGQRAGEGGEAGGEGDSQSSQHGLLTLVRRFVNVRDLDIDLIDQINPFQRAYEVLSRSMTAHTLQQVQSVIASQRVSMTEEEAVALYQRIKRFKRANGRAPDLTSQDPFERRLAEALAWLQEKKREQMRANAEGAASAGER